MSDIKFACPHCQQHIVCDDLYCGEAIACPGCQVGLFVPPLAASIPLPSGSLVVAPPVASREKVRPVPPSVAPRDRVQSGPPPLAPWTESGWRRHEVEVGAQPSGSMLPFWLMLVLPFFVALLFLAHKGSLTVLLVWFLTCAAAAGFYLAYLQTHAPAEVAVRGVLYALGLVFVYFVLAFGLLFVGCLLAI